MPKRYNAAEVEPKWQEYWEKNSTYRFDVNHDDKVYSIDTPPPTISGRMHMGHAFGNSQQDFIARYKRMRGFNVLQPFGTDDNGLATQLYIEKLKNVRASQMDRQEFVGLCLETLSKELRPSFMQDWKRLGISCDFSVYYTTIDEHCRRISQWSFIELYNMGRAYRKEAPAMWCPKCGTAISQVELEDKERPSTFNDIIFNIDGKDVTIATTRPELLPACVAVFYHPGDSRYKGLKGKKARVPLFNLEVPVLEDERADPEKGTGIVMCCTFGDQTDVEWQKQYDLPIRMAIDRRGVMTDIAGKYAGKSLTDARREVTEDMKRAGLLVSEKPIMHAVNTHERCGTEIEFIHSKQWFIKYLDLKDEMLRWGKELRWFPSHMKNRYDNWVKGLSWDWCISRQIQFGIPIPIWYCKSCGGVILAKHEDLPVDPLVDKPPVEQCPKCKGKQFDGETDVMCTWATSSLTPTIVKELFRGKPIYNYLVKNPMSLRPQGHDIITFWLFNTVLKSQLHFNMKPWQDCFINGWILDAKGKKMSKSKGNIIEPQEKIKEYSADILRYMAAGSKLGEDLAFPEKELVAGKRFVTKLWNASRFCVSHLEKYDGGAHSKPGKLRLIDRWMLSRLYRVIKESTEAFEVYEFSKCKAAVENLFWHEFCNYYLELVKDRIYNPKKYGREAYLSAQYTLYKCILAVIKMFAPFTPFVTEGIYQLYFAGCEKKESLHKSSWPIFDKALIDEEAEKLGGVIMQVLSEVRKSKTARNMSLKEPVRLVMVKAKIKKEDFLKVEEDIKAATKSEGIEYSLLDKNSNVDCECLIEF